MARNHKSHPQAPLYGPGGSSGTDLLTQLTQYQGALSIGWSQLTSVPTTISGYGITDAYTDSEVDALLLTKADVGDSYTKAEADALLADKADAATTLAGYGITDAYTETEVDALFAALTAADIDSGTFPGTSAYVIGGGGTLKVESTVSSTFPMSFRGYASGDNFVCGMEIVDSIGAQYGSWAKAQSGDANIYFQSYKGGMKFWGRLGSIEFAPGGTTTKWTFDQTTFDLIAASGAMARLAASTTSKATLRIPHGSAPTSPVNGDMWTTTAGLFVRINGATVGPLT